MPVLTIFENAELTLVPCRRCPRRYVSEVDQDTRQVLAYHGFGIPLRAGEPWPRAFDRLLGALCGPPAADQRVKELDHDVIIARLPAPAGG